MQRLLYSFRQALAAPSRNPRTAVVLGRLLGISFIVCFLTGLYSHFIQNPIPGMWFPNRPIFLYQVTQGIHITAGILCFPLILGKLYAIYPLLFQTPPIRGFLHFLERASIALFVASSLVEITIGLLNTYQWYKLFAFPFRQTHFTLAFIVIGSLAIHIGVKLGTIQKYWRKRDALDGRGDVIPLDGDTGSTTTVPVREDEPVAAAMVGAQAADPQGVGSGGVTGRIFAWIDSTPQPKAPRVSRRGFMTTIGLGVAAVVGLTAGQSFKVLDFANVFGPRKNNVGPNALPVNRTASAAKVLTSAKDAAWVLTVTAGSQSKTFSRTELEALPQHTVELPISCVEGWSQMATWKGPRLKDLFDSVGAHPGSTIRATSLEKGSIYAVMEMPANFVRDDLTLVALHVNGAVLDIDHGYPARIIAPARPGVLQTKWLSKLETIS
jgi:hypothetical protein